MTILELNALPLIELNIVRIMAILDRKIKYPDFFLKFDEVCLEEELLSPILSGELDRLMDEHRRLTAYIDGISDPWMKGVFEMRYIGRMSFREIGIKYRIDSGVLKQEVYSWVRLNPEGYLSCRDLSEKWGVNINTVNNWCRKGLLQGAKKRGIQRWIVPLGATRPIAKNRR